MDSPQNIYPPHPIFQNFLWHGFALAEAACSHVVELARAHVAENPRVSPEIRRFACVKVKDAEIGVHALLGEYGLRVPLTIHNIDAAGIQFPSLKLSDWAKHLWDTGRFARQLVGCSVDQMPAVLTEFWVRYKELYPNHEIFRLGIDFRYAVPFYSHTDEGRSQKHDPIWVLSCHGALGRGTRRFVAEGKHRKPISENEMGLNFLGQTMSNQFLICTILKKVASDYPGALAVLLGAFAADAATLCREGLDCSGHRIRLVHLGTKGDLPALGKIGHFTRTFSHVARRPSTKTPCEGVCHLCLGGQEANPRTGAQHFPFEDLTPTPVWEPTMHTVLPWGDDDQPEILQNLPVDRETISGFFCLDIWHNFHLGACKHWIANAWVVIVESQLLPRMSVEDKFKNISEEYVSFCEQHRLGMWITEISREALTWPQSSATPIGKWNKGSCSTTMMMFLDYYCQKFVKGKSDDPLLVMIVSCWMFVCTYVFVQYVWGYDRFLFPLPSLPLVPACSYLSYFGVQHVHRFFCAGGVTKADATSAMNQALSTMYSSGYWLNKNCGKSVSKKMFFFLYTYQCLAHASLAAGKNRFSMMPKLHCLSHTALQLKKQAEGADWVQNPLSSSVQMQEDFIGRPARVSRRCNIRQVHRNVLHRCLILAQVALEKSDEDYRGRDCYA